MAHPQVFISSTYYDLKSVRDDLARFLKDLGYDTIRHEIGSVPYARTEKLETSCYREVENCDILICIVGGRYGSSSAITTGSITQNELRSAYDQGKQIYIFVDKSVYSEWHFYQKNKQINEVVYSAVNDKKVFEFLDEVNQLPIGNPLFPFETSNELVSVLKEQLSGLFKRFLGEESQKLQNRLFDELKASIATVGELAKYLSAKSDQGHDLVNRILITDHPLFVAIRTAMNIRYRVFFMDITELNQWVSAAKTLKPVSPEDWDNVNFREWFRRDTEKNGDEYLTLFKIKDELFDTNGRLKPVGHVKWSEDFVSYSRKKVAPSIYPDDDIPF
jgi:Domain of unknown function (DUF4062)